MKPFRPKINFQIYSRERAIFCRIAQISATAIFLLAINIILLPCPPLERSFAESETDGTTSLTISGNGAITFSVLPSVFNSASQTASVSTTNYDGYTLIMQTAGESTALVGVNSSIPTIADNDLIYNQIHNAYGFTFTGYREGLYQPAPELGSAIQLDSTDSANHQANIYDLTFGAEVDSLTPAGGYSNIFNIVAVANNVGYTINYLPNASTDVVSNMPFPASQVVTISGGGFVLSDATPTRTGYIFLGWSEDPTDTSIIYQAGGTFIPSSWATGTFSLYAIWVQNTQVIYNANGGTFASSNATNQVIYSPKCNNYKTNLNKSKTAAENQPVLMSMTSNIDPNLAAEGFAGGDISPEAVTDYYDNNLEAFDTMTFPGASAVVVQIYYNVPDSNDIVGIMSGAIHSITEVYEHQEDIQAMYSDTGDQVHQDQVTVSGDTVTLGIYSDGNISGLGYVAFVVGLAPNGEDFVPGYHITNDPSTQIIAMSDNIDFQSLFQEFSTTGTYSGPPVAAPSTNLSFETIDFPEAEHIIFEGTLWDAGDGYISVYAGEISTLEEAAKATPLATFTNSGVNTTPQNIPSNRITIVYNNSSDGYYAAIFEGQNANGENVTGYDLYTPATINGGQYCSITGYYEEPNYAGHNFIGWSTNPSATEAIYPSERSFYQNYLYDDPASSITLYAVWKYYSIRYDGNGSDAGTMLHMAKEGIVKGDSITLSASNFSRSGYGFAGWENGNGRTYGPNETITVNNNLLSLADSNGDITFHAKWIQSSGYLQDWDGCNILNQPIALTDTRDGNTYAVARLADGNCWMIENLRLDNTADFADTTKSGNFGGGFIGLANPEVTNFSDSTVANSLYDTHSSLTMPRYDNTNTYQPALDPTSNNANIYSYGNYYSWAATIANTDSYGDQTNPTRVAETSICPSGWSLPSKDDFVSLDTALGGEGKVQKSLEAANRWRMYPNNFILSGRITGSLISSRGGGGFFWSLNSGYFNADTGEPFANEAYITSIGNEIVDPDSSGFKYIGFSVRCHIYPYTYTIIYNANTTDPVSGTMMEQHVKRGESVELRSNTFSRATSTVTYQFTGWNTKPDGSGISYSDRAVVSDLAYSGDSITLYAQWGSTKKLLEIVYDGNGATSGSTATQYIAENSSDYLYTNGFVKTDYAFIGWNTEPDGLGTSYHQSDIYNVGQISLGDSITLYAQWSAGLTINFNGNGATSGSTDSQIIPAGVSANLNANGFSLENYKFAGWNTEPDGSGVSYGDGRVFTAPIDTTVGDTQTLYAQWKSLYSIQYDDNGASGGRTMNVTNADVAEGDSVTLYAPNYSNPGYGFAGWSANSSASPNDGSSTIYGPNETITFTNSLIGLADAEHIVTLYAVWVAAETDQNQGPIYLQDFDVTACANMALGEVVALTDERDGDTYAITKLFNGVCYMMENLRLDNSAELSATNTNSPVLPLINSYNNNITSNHLSASSDTWCSNLNVTCLASIETDENCVNQSQINTNNTSSTLPPSPDIDYDVAYGNEIYSWYSYGTMYSWYSATAGNGTFNTVGDTAGDICPAGWHLPNSNNINSGGMNITRFPFNTVYSGVYMGTSADDRGVFGSYWTGNGNHVNSDGTTVAGTAHYIQVKNQNYSISEAASSIGMAVRCILGEQQYRQYYDANGLTYSDSSTLNTTVYTHDVNSSTWQLVDGTYKEPVTTEFQEFVGWDTNPNATTATYTSEAEILEHAASNYNPGAVYEDGEAYFAIWRRLAKVIYNGNGDDSNSSITRYVADGSTEFVGNGINFEKSGYNIVGWNTEPDGSGISITNGYNYQYLSNDHPDNFVVTLYAQWAPGFTVSYDDNGADTGIMGQTAVPNNAAEITLTPPNFIKYGYGFAGWSTAPLNPTDANFASDFATTTIFGPNATIETSIANFGTTAPAAITLYAVWIPIATDSNGDALTFQTSALATTTLSDGDTLSNKSIGYITALKDERDNQVYAIAKLADGNYWMIENLRLPYGPNLNITINNTNNPTYTFINTDVANILNGTDTEYWKSCTDNSCVDQLSVGLGNLSGTSPASFSANNQETPWYSYGTMYNWYTATGGNGTLSNTSADGAMSGDICPAGWHLPSGTGSGEFGILSNALGGYQVNNVARNMNSSTTPTGATMSAILRSYPNNFIYAGYYSDSSASNRGAEGYYWSSSASASSNAHDMHFYESYVYPGTGTISKKTGLAVRCLIN